MSRIRLLPIVLFASTALLLLKVIGLATGVGSFAVGPQAATAAGAAAGGGHGGGTAPAGPSTAEQFLQPLDLAAEARAMKAAEEEAAAKAAGGHGAEPAHGAAADDHAEAAPAADDHAAAAPAADDHAEAAPAADDHGAEAGPEGHAPATPAEAGHGSHAAAEGHGAPAGDGHGEGAAAPVSTERPAEYQPPVASSEGRVLESLAARRAELDRRAEDLETRSKLLEAAEAKLEARIKALEDLQTQLDGAAGGGAGDGAAKEAEQVKTLATLYESMKPKAAARVFDDLDQGVLIAVARAMSPRKLSPVIAAMDPKRAAMLTAALAGDQRPREVVVRREAGPEPQAGAQPSIEDLPKIMPAGDEVPPAKPAG